MLLEQSNQAKQDLEQAKVAVSTAQATLQAQANAERMQMLHAQQAVEAAQHRTLEVQREVERQVAQKQEEFAVKEQLLNKEKESAIKANVELEQSIASLLHKVEERNSAQLSEMEFRLRAQQDENVMLKRQLHAMQKTPETFRMDLQDTDRTYDAVGQTSGGVAPTTPPRIGFDMSTEIVGKQSSGSVALTATTVANCQACAQNTAGQSNGSVALTTPVPVARDGSRPSEKRYKIKWHLCCK